MNMKRTRFPNNTPLEKPLPEITEMKELIFAHEYLTDLDPVGAGIRSGLISMRVRPKEQEAQAVKIFQRQSVQAHIKGAIQDRIARTGITEDKVLRELGNLAFYNFADFINEEGDYKDIRDLPRDLSCVIQELEYKVIYGRQNGQRVANGHITKLKTYDKKAALSALLGHLTGKASEAAPINYNQFNIGQKVNGNIGQQNVKNKQLDMSDFTDIELQVIRKMTGGQDPAEVIELQRLEAEYYEPQPV